MDSNGRERPRRRSLFTRKRASASDVYLAHQYSQHPRPNAAASAISLQHSALSSSAQLAADPLSSTDSLNSTLGTRANIIPDALKQLPSWYSKEIDVPASVHHFRSRYPIHNPSGPRYYLNVHLRPPNSGPPPLEAFSTAFPLLTPNPENQPGPSRTPSGTPLPTPASSQSRLNEPMIRQRTRKISNSAPQDTVDLLDATDPLGNAWHHTSPYDALTAGADKATTIPDATAELRLPRPRLPSSTSKHKTATPSPLSQSTSVPSAPLAHEDNSRSRRKLSKRRRSIREVFGSSKDTTPAAHVRVPSTSAPATPLDDDRPTYLDIPGGTAPKHSSYSAPRSIPKSVSTTSIPTVSSLFPSEKRQKRGSVLGRLARGLSVLKRPSKHVRTGSDTTGLSDRGSSMHIDRHSAVHIPYHTSPEKLPPNARPGSDASRRVPVPSVDPESEAPSISERKASVTESFDDRSSLSIEAQFTSGRLTIVNPDVPSSSDTSPVTTPVPLPRKITPPPSHPTSARPQPQSDTHPPRSQSIARPSHIDAVSPQTTRRTSAQYTHATPGPSVFRVDKELPVPNTSPLLLSTCDLFPEPLQALRAPAKHPASPGHSSPMQTPAPSTGQSLPFPSSRGHHSSRADSRAKSPSVTSSRTHKAVAYPAMSYNVAAPIEDTPLSRASIVVNPPTPHADPTPIPPALSVPIPRGSLHLSFPEAQLHSPSPLQAVQASESLKVPAQFDARTRSAPNTASSSSRRESARQSRSSGSKSRETETFRLIRSPSGNSPLAGETPEKILAQGEHWEVIGSSSSSKRSKAKSRDDSSRRSSSRREKSERRHEEQHDAGAKSRHSTRVSVASSGNVEPDKPRSSKESTSHRKHQSGDSPTRAPRRPSIATSSTRPTSEITSAAELHAVRAREVWEMERLWKGQSMMYGPDGPHVVYAQSIGNASTTTLSPSPGSHHTAYHMQAGFLPNYVYPSGLRSYPDFASMPIIASPEPEPPRRLAANPLPDPPRRSTYRPPPPLGLDPAQDTGSWARYSGVPVTATSY